MNKLKDDWELLTNVSNDIEADILISLLNSYDIQAKKHYPTGGIVSKSIVGTLKNVDIYVKGKVYKEAKDIISYFKE